MATDIVPIRRALLSVSDKTGIVELATGLAAKGVELVSTGGTAKALRDAGLSVRDVSDLTGFPEMMDGRVKTLHPMVHGGLLAVRDDPEHAKAMDEHAIGAIDLVVVNLYPFAQTVAKGAERDEIIENIDIGGPSMVRSAAKNHAFVAIVTDPADYALLDKGETMFDERKKLAAKAFAATATYDSMIASWFGFADQGQMFPETLPLILNQPTALRYGENPHQQAAFYRHAGPSTRGIGQARQVQGKELSYNNLNDADAALQLVAEFRDAEPTCVIVKHANPSGVATAANLEAAYAEAFACDTVSAFGGIIALNVELDGKTAEAIAKLFVEVLIAPGFTAEALAIMKGKQNVRLLEIPLGTGQNPYDVKRVGGGLLVQSPDAKNIGIAELKVVTKLQPTQQQLQDLMFAWRVAKFVKSNAIVFCANGMTLGVGAGQMSRIDSARIASIKAQNVGLSLVGSAVASDAFFPFRDGLDVVVDAGATCVIQPGGSMRDQEVIDAADERGVVMLTTGARHFRH